jgi:uncharacterized metal-binding protein
MKRTNSANYVKETKEMAILPQCAKCSETFCRRMPGDEVSKNLLPKFCPMKINENAIKTATDRYGQENVRKIYIPSTVTEKEAYEWIRGVRMAVRPRIKELIEFSRLINAQTIGVAFCAGMRDEAARIVKVLEKSGLATASVLCKCGGIDKTKLGVAKEYKIGSASGFEAGCNPVLQAQLLNDAGTDINVIVGLCIGHDMLFTMNSKAPVTTLIVKDRLLGHNPVIALYSDYHKDVIESQKRT